jgi:hypothetical protein
MTPELASTEVGIEFFSNSCGFLLLIYANHRSLLDLYEVLP